MSKIQTPPTAKPFKTSDSAWTKLANAMRKALARPVDRPPSLKGIAKAKAT